MRPVCVFANGPGSEMQRLRSGLRGPWRPAVRAVMVLLSVQGLPAAQIARLLECHPATVRRWIGRFNRDGAAGLADRPRSGRPRLGGRRLARRVAALLERPGPWTLPVLELLPDGSYRSVPVNPKVTGKARGKLIEAARIGEDLDPGKARPVRVIEYEAPDRDGDGKGELIALITTITDPRHASAAALARAYQERWEHETRERPAQDIPARAGQGAALAEPDMVRQEIYGYLLTTHYAISALICRAATATGVDPDRVRPPVRW